MAWILCDAICHVLIHKAVGIHWNWCFENLIYITGGIACYQIARCAVYTRDVQQTFVNNSQCQRNHCISIFQACVRNTINK